jgi:hypothetical protein
MCSEDVQKQHRCPEERAGSVSPGGWRLELDLTVFGDVAPSKVASSGIDRKGLVLHNMGVVDLHRKPGQRRL